MSTVITIKDRLGERMHTMSHDAIEVTYRPNPGGKIGTVVIIDLRMIDVPKVPPVSFTMDATDVTLKAGGEKWVLSNADAERYVGVSERFYLTVRSGILSVQD